MCKFLKSATGFAGDWAGDDKRKGKQRLRIKSLRAINECLETHARNVQESLRAKYSGTRLASYSAEGKQKATTTVVVGSKKKPFETKSQMHSEMRAVEYMLANGLWFVHTRGDGSMYTTDAEGTGVQPQSFGTDLPHCGHCTLMLLTLGLPLSQPTRGNYLLAAEGDYPLPESLKTLEFLTALLDFDLIRILLQCFVEDSQQMTARELWDVLNNDNRKLLRRFIFKQLYAVNQRQ